MSYLPSPYTGFYRRIDNTVVSGSQLMSYLSGGDVRDLEFEAATSGPDAVITPITAGSTLTSATGPSMTPQQLIQATILSAPVVYSTPSVTGATGFISLGPDTAAQALTWISLLNLTSSQDRRFLRFTQAQPLNWANTIAIGNSSNTATYIVPRNSFTGSPTQTGSTVLFSEANAVGTLLSGRDGSERIVMVSPTGSPPSIVYFDVLGASQ